LSSLQISHLSTLNDWGFNSWGTFCPLLFVYIGNQLEHKTNIGADYQ